MAAKKGSKRGAKKRGTKRASKRAASCKQKKSVIDIGFTRAKALYRYARSKGQKGTNPRTLSKQQLAKIGSGRRKAVCRYSKKK